MVWEGEVENLTKSRGRGSGQKSHVYEGGEEKFHISKGGIRKISSGGGWRIFQDFCISGPPVKLAILGISCRTWCVEHEYTPYTQ
jgi:hypothetical protein